MHDFVNLEVRVWHGDEWPENRVSIACTDAKHAVMISPRYAHIDQAEANARHIVHCVNNHDRLVKALRKVCDMQTRLKGNATETHIELDDVCRDLRTVLAQLDTKGEE